MLPFAIVVAAVTAATPTPQTPEPPPPPQAVRLTVGVSGDLLPHLPVVARARALAGGRGYDFRPLLRPIRRWVRRNSLAICHIETPLAPAPPVGYPRFNSPPALARAVKATGFDACTTASNHSLDRGQAGIDATRRALDRAGVRHTGSFSSRRQRRRPLLLRAHGVQGRPPRLHGDDQRHPAAASVVGQPRPRRADPARRAQGAPRRRAGRDRQSPLGHRVPARAGRVPDGARPAARPLGRSPRWSASTRTSCSRSGGSAGSGSCSARATCSRTRPPHAVRPRPRTGCSSGFTSASARARRA